MREEREWMYQMHDENGYLRLEFVNQMERSFIRHVLDRPNLHVKDNEGNTHIRCPCQMCHNQRFELVETVRCHILEYGFVPDYYQWDRHGEEYIPQHAQEHNQEEMNAYVRMVHDAVGPSFDPHGIEEDPNPQARQLYEALRSASCELWSGCRTHSKLSIVAQLLSIKSEEYMTVRCFDRVAQLIKSALPEDNCLPENFYETKRLMDGLGLPVERIDCCIQGCMIYWGDDFFLQSCKFCSQPRYKEKKNQNQKYDVAYKRMFYFPLIPRLQRLYASEATAKHMRWHAEHFHDRDTMTHCSDALAWKYFDQIHPNFAAETRNVRLGLSTDGFQPFGSSGEQYSCWPVFVTPYNLPPWMCMKHEYIFITALVPGPKNPKQKIDIFLQPLMKELQKLWIEGIYTYDVSLKQNFQMRAALMWTISDFPAYSMLSGWTTSGFLACPHCMEDSDAFSLRHGSKVCWFDCHRRFLPRGHHFRRDKTGFLKGKIVTKSPPKHRTGIEILEQIEQLGLMKVTEIGAEAHNQRVGKLSGWKKRSIFWDLPYWKTNLIRHNIDVMHAEKNVFDNLFCTIMAIKGKSKDNPNARKDVAELCDRKELEKNTSTQKYPKAAYCLDTNQKKVICQWLKSSVKFSDGYASNLARCVDMGKYRLFGMKTHDCHVFMQRLIHIAFRYNLPRSIWETITELSSFFLKLTSNVIKPEEMKTLEKSAPVLLCKLERIFPPAFFDSMEHLTIHLPFEARIAGPVQYRWMYPFERMMKQLKKNATNKAHVEGSICNALLVQEVATFCSHYFEAEVYAKERRIPRNHWQSSHDENNGMNTCETLPIFSHPGRAAGKESNHRMKKEEYDLAHRYILLNCPEIKPCIDMFIDEIQRSSHHLSQSEIDARLTKDFADWFKNLAKDHPNLITDPTIRSMSRGPLISAKTYPIYFVNGYKFHTRSYGAHKSSSNWGVCIKGTVGNSEICNDYYGMLEDILEVEYPALPIKRVVLFRCQWFDNHPINGTKVHKRYGIVEVNHTRRLNVNEPFVLASQASQVCYVPYPNANRTNAQWWAVCQIKSRSIILVNEQERTDGEAPYQADNELHINAFQLTDDGDVPLLADPQGEGFTDDDEEEDDVVPLVDSDAFDDEEEDPNEED